MQKNFCDRCNEETESYIEHEYIYRSQPQSLAITASFKIKREVGELCPECMLAVINDFGLDEERWIK